MSPPTASDSTASRLQPEPAARRDFLGISAVTAAAVSLAFALIGMLRLPRAAVLSSPSKKFRVTLPESLSPGQPFIPPGRAVALFRDEEGVYAISTVCTHLGCLVKSSGEGFECPCHGSKFALDGSVTKGPAPVSLPWRKVTASGDSWVVDEEATVAPGTKEKI